MSANIDFKTSKIRKLEGSKQTDEVVTVDDVRDPEKLARLLTRVLAKQADIERQWRPKYNDYENVVCAGTDSSPQELRFTHMFDGPVRWWVTSCRKGGTVALPYVQEAHNTDGSPKSDQNTLVLLVFFEATLAIRIQEAGA